MRRWVGLVAAMVLWMTVIAGWVHGGGKPGVVGGVVVAVKRKKAPVKKRPAKKWAKLKPFPLSVAEENRITARNERCR